MKSPRNFNELLIFLLNNPKILCHYTFGNKNVNYLYKFKSYSSDKGLIFIKENDDTESFILNINNLIYRPNCFIRRVARYNINYYYDKHSKKDSVSMWDTNILILKTKFFKCY